MDVCVGVLGSCVMSGVWFRPSINVKCEQNCSVNKPARVNYVKVCIM